MKGRVLVAPARLGAMERPVTISSKVDWREGSRQNKRRKIDIEATPSLMLRASARNAARADNEPKNYYRTACSQAWTEACR